MSATVKTIYWILKVLVAGILLQTLFFKFTAAPESVYIFSTLGMEPWGRIGSGVAELIASILILYPRIDAFGALMSLGVISGAIMSHLLFLGIEVQGDGGLLFIMAITVFVASTVVLYLRREQLLSYLPSGIKTHLAVKKKAAFN